VLANQTLYFTVSGAWVQFSKGGMATGMIIDVPKLPVPLGFLECDGTIYNVPDYPDLAAYLGSSYGGDGTTTFGVPNYKGRVLVCRDAAQVEFDAIGETGGTKTHTLTSAEIPAHTHPDNLAAPQHQHGPGSGSFFINSGTTATFAAGSSGRGTSTLTGNANATALTGSVLANTGGGGAHNNLQPYAVVVRAIKT
jgi:microcystin-dependent protein